MSRRGIIEQFEDAGGTLSITYTAGTIVAVAWWMRPNEPERSISCYRTWPVGSFPGAGVSAKKFIKWFSMIVGELIRETGFVPERE